MSGGQYGRIKTWAIDEILKTTDLNTEFDNIIANSDANHLGGYSNTVGQMQIQTNPGDLGSEHLATSIAEELAELRFVIQRMLGTSTQYWYQAPPTDLSSVSSAVNQISLIPSNRLLNGKVDANGFSSILRASGTTNEVTIQCSGTPLSCYIDGTPYTFNTDIVITGLSLGTGDTCATTALAQPVDGEQDSVIQIGTLAAGVSAYAGTGKLAAFKAPSGEYFVSQVTPSTLRHGFRGYFFDSAGLITPRASIASLATITLMRITYVFLKSDATGFVTYTQPTYSAVAPTGPGIGDMWYNVKTQIWSQYSGAVWVAVAAVLVGMCIQDATACVATRSKEFYAFYSDLNTIDLEVKDTLALNIGAKNVGSMISVAGTTLDYDQACFNISSTQVETGGIFVNGNTLYIYIKSTGVPVLSLTAPYDRRADLAGFYHPYANWRCIGFSDINATPQFGIPQPYLPLITPAVAPPGKVDQFAGTVIPAGFLECDGAAVSRSTYLNLFAAIGETHGSGDGTTTFNKPDYRGRFLRGVDGVAGRDPDKLTRTAMATGGNAGNLVGSIQAYATGPATAPLTISGTTGGESVPHVHRAFTAYWIDGGTWYVSVGGGGVGMTTALDTNENTTDHTHTFTGGVSGGGDAETRPINAYVNFMIKI